MSTPIPIAVECYSGHTFADRPIAFIWKGQRYEIERILKQWRSPDGDGFRVTTSHGSKFELTYSQTRDEWSLHPHASGCETVGKSRYGAPRKHTDGPEAKTDA